MVARKLAPALAAGCSMLVKPSDRTPFIALADLAERAGMPPGVLSVLTGASREIVRVIADSPVVRKLSFTGSTEVGKMLIRQCADTVKRMSMELGGNAPVLIFADADIEAALDGLMALKFHNGGQTCVCANRIFVERGLLSDFSRAFVERVRALKVGPGDQPGVQLGPLITPAAAEDMGRIVAEALHQGAELLIGGGAAGRTLEAGLDLRYSACMVFFTWIGCDDDMHEVRATAPPNCSMTARSSTSRLPKRRRGHPRSQTADFFSSPARLGFKVGLYPVLPDGGLKLLKRLRKDSLGYRQWREKADDVAIDAAGQQH
jgi:hypothetical protein